MMILGVIFLGLIALSSLVQAVFHLEQFVALALHQLRNGNARRPCDDLRDFFRALLR